MIKFPDIKKLLKENKKLSNILIIVIAGLLLILIGDFITSGSSKKSPGESETAGVKVITDYEESKKAELKNILEKTKGVGNVEVMLTFESGEEAVPAVNETDSVSDTKEQDNSGGTRTTTQKNSGSTVVMQSENGNSQPLIIKTYKPKVTGVYIVAEGAANNLTELEIKGIVSKLFDISTDKVSVMPMKK
ncbi:MAG: stage III sporulation protein AG [Bacillota bacterium]|nr:stage III sporulation protein AG [Bacillota bacterium]